jgi:hypothetical protein
VVGLSQTGGSITVQGVKGGTFRDAVSGREVTVGDGGALSFEVKASSAGIYVLNGPGKIGADGLYLR